MSESIATSALHLRWSQVTWDTKACGFPVIQIEDIEVFGPQANADIASFEVERDRLGVGLVSCRLGHERMKESMLLEDHGFRFIEMLYQPQLELAARLGDVLIVRLDVTLAGEADLPILMEIAGTAFQNERFKIDFRLDPRLSDQRYRNWVANSLHHPAQELYVVREGARVVAFFITEMLEDRTCYWHLNAVATDAQGRGYGRRAWVSMLDRATEQGALRVRTSIVARNHRVLNLYASLGFHFSEPLMTFHWVRKAA